MSVKKSPLKIEYLLMIIVSFFWAIGHPLGRIVSQSFHPFQTGAMTLNIGLLGVLAYLVVTGKIKKMFKLPFRDILISFGLGVFGFFLYQILTFSALSRIPASINAVLVSNNVVFIAILAAWVLKERISPPSIIGILLAIAGVVLVTFNQGFSLESGSSMDFTGFAFSLLAALSFAIYSVIGKRVLVSNDPLIIAALALFSGSVLLTVLTASTVGFSGVFKADASSIWILVFLGLTMIGIAYPLWFACLKRLPASHVSIYIYLTPVFAVILSLIILHERFSWLFWLGGALILGGIIITSRFASSGDAARKKASGQESKNH